MGDGQRAKLSWRGVGGEAKLTGALWRYYWSVSACLFAAMSLSRSIRQSTAAEMDNWFSANSNDDF